MNHIRNNGQAFSRLQTLALWIVVAGVAISPWLFGSAEPWAYLSVGLVISLGTALWLASLVLGARARTPPPLLTAAMLAVALFMCAQMVRLPRAFVRVIAPLNAEVQLTGRRILAQIEAPCCPVHRERGVSVSVSRFATRRSLYLMAAYAGAFLVLVGCISGRSQLRWVSKAIVASCFAMALFALVQNFTETRSIYWFHKPRLGGTIFGPFSNRNHFAAYMNLAMGLTLGLLFIGTRALELREYKTWQEKISWLSTRKANQIILLSFVAIMLGAAVLLSLSRGALASLAAALAIVAGATTLTGRTEQRRWLIGTLSLLIVATVVWLGWEPVLKRLGATMLLSTDPLKGTRFGAAYATLRAWGASPLVGSGFGTFQHFFPFFQDRGIQIGRFLHAHNDYAQLLSEGGLAGFALVVALVVVFVRTLRARWIGASEDARLFVGGVLVGLITTSLHSLVDFSLHKPSNALFFVTLCGLAVTALGFPSRSRQRSRQEPEDEAPPLRGGARLLTLAGLVAVVVLAFLELRELPGELAFARFVQWQKMAEKLETPSDHTAAVEMAAAEADQIIALGHTNPDGLLDVTVATLWRTANPALSPELRIRLARQAELAAVLAVYSAPSDYEYWLWLGRALTVQNQPYLSGLCMARARALAPPGMPLEPEESPR